MSREIMLRAFDKNTKEMLSWDMLCERGVELIDLAIAEDANIVFMQFTGLNDKNGKDIYEGDVICVSIPNVTHDNGTKRDFRCEVVVEYSLQHCGYGNMLSKTDFIEVIGNRYQNPELLPKEVTQ